MRRRDHPVFYHSNSSSDLNMTQNELQNELKMSLGSPPAPKVAKVGSRTPYSQSPYCHLEPNWLPKGVHFQTKFVFKIGLMSEVEKEGDLKGHRVVQWTLQTSKINENHLRGCNFQLFTLFSRKALFDQFSSSRGSLWEPFGSLV